MKNQRKGVLYIVATPIGNLEDVTLRALRVLREADLIAAEDTRTTRKLLEAHGIKTPQVSYHEQGRAEPRVQNIIRELKMGRDVAMVSEAGTPGISDPGYLLVRRCIDEGIHVVPIPGPCVLVAALSVSGLPTDRFVFEGFLPRRRGQLRRALEALKGEPRTMVFFESPRRLRATLSLMLEVLGDRRAVVARELTKRFEEVARGRISELILWSEMGEIKGEVTIVVEGAPRERLLEWEVERLIRSLQKECNLSRGDLTCVVHHVTGAPKKEIYRLIHGGLCGGGGLVDGKPSG